MLKELSLNLKIFLRKPTSRLCCRNLCYNPDITSFQKLVATSLVIVALSFAYYLILFLPQKEQQRLKQEQQKEQQDNQLRQQQLLGLQQCLQNAENRTNYFRIKNCIDLGLENGCDLPRNRIEDVKNFLESLKQDCYKAYPQK